MFRCRAFHLWSNDKSLYETIRSNIYHNLTILEGPTFDKLLMGFIMAGSRATAVGKKETFDQEIYAFDVCRRKTNIGTINTPTTNIEFVIFDVRRLLISRLKHFCHSTVNLWNTLHFSNCIFHNRKKLDKGDRLNKSLFFYSAYNNLKL